MKRQLFIITILIMLSCANCLSQWQVVNSGISNNLISGCFINDSTILLISNDGVISKSNDFGNSWISTDTLTGNFSKIYYTGHDTVYACGNNLYRSNDAGNSWSLITSFGFIASDLGFFNSRHGYLIQPDGYPCTWGGGTVYLDSYRFLETNDFGITWTQLFNDLDNSSRIQIVADSMVYFSGSKVNVQYHCAGPTYNTSKCSNDQGLNWINVFQANVYYMHSIFSFANKDTGYFIAPYDTSHIFMTTDGSVSMLTKNSVLPGYQFKQVYFINSIDGFLITTNKIYSTTTRGITWDFDYGSSLNLNYTLSNKNNLVVAIGDSGLIIKKPFIASLYSDSVYRLKSNKTSINFGNLLLGDSKVDSVLLTNTGNQPLNISVKTASPFKLSLTNSNFNDTTATVFLNPDSVTMLYIQFNPIFQDNYIDSIFFSADSLETLKLPIKGFCYPTLNYDINTDTIICIDTLRIGANITIADSATLTICPGTKVLFMGNFSITVNGLIKAIGDSLDNIDFIVADSATGWSGILINHAGNIDSSEFVYCNLIANCKQDIFYNKSGLLFINHCNISNQNNNYGALSIFSWSTNPRLILLNSNIYGIKSGFTIYMWYSDSSVISNNTIYNNGYGIVVNNSNHVKIHNNKIFNIKNYGIDFSNGSGEISHNAIYNNFGGIYADLPKLNISDNIIFNNSLSCGGISYYIIDTAIIYQNLIFNNEQWGGGAGLDLFLGQNTSYLLIANNTVCNNKAHNASGFNFYADGFAAGKIDLYNNIFYSIADSDKNFVFKPIVVLNQKNNCINMDSAIYWGAGNIKSNPNLVMPTDSNGAMNNLGSFDWSLKQNSLCINAGNSGNTSFLSTYDIDSNSRIYNNIVDIGTYEYQGFYSGPIDSSSNFTSDLISVFPNPSPGVFNIYFKQAISNCSIEIYNSIGQLIFTYELKNQNQIDLSNQPNGLYFLKVLDSELKVIARTKLSKLKR